MSDQKQYIISLCNQLTRAGKKPSVALIKKSANGPLPLPLIISVLKRYQQAPDQFSDVENESLTQAPPMTLEQQVAELQQRVKSLEEQLSQLLSQKN